MRNSKSSSGGNAALRVAGAALACLAFGAASTVQATAASTYTVIQTTGTAGVIGFQAPLVQDPEISAILNGQSKVGQVLVGIGKPLVEFRFLASIPYGTQYVMKIATWNNGSPSGQALWTSPIRTSTNVTGNPTDVSETMKIKLNKGTRYAIYLEWVYPLYSCSACGGDVRSATDQYVGVSIAQTPTSGWVPDDQDLVFRAKFV